MRTFSFELHAKKFNEACDWLISLGVRIERTRIEDYQRDCEQIAAYTKAGKISDLVETRGFRKLVNSLTESAEIIDIHTGIRAVKCQDLSFRVRETTWGCVLLTDEKPESGGTDARNKAFELFMMSVLARCDFEILPHHKCDVWFQGPNFKAGVECKRPFSEKGIWKALRDGRKQLRGYYEADSSVRGIVAISISKALNDGSRCMNAPDEAGANALTERVVDSFYHRHERLFDRLRERQTMGIILHLRAPVFTVEPYRLLTADQFAFVILSPEGHFFMKNLESRLSSLRGL